jgi:hypothetical protein
MEAMIMAALTEDVKREIIDNLKEKIVVEAPQLTPKALKKEGTQDVDDYVKSVADDFNGKHMGAKIQEQMASANYYPTILDPTIYNQGVLYEMTPALTYLEAKGRRTPAGSTKQDYIKLTAGFAGEWITEVTDTSGSGEATTGTASAAMKYLALPVSMSDMIGVGDSRGAREQLMNFAQQALREEFNQTIVSGDKDAGAGNEFDGLFEIAKDSSTRANFSSAAMTLEDMDAQDAVLSQTLATPSTAVFTNVFTLNQLKKDLYGMQQHVNNVTVTAGVNPVAYSNSRGTQIPIIVDQNVPSTGTARRLLFFNERHLFIRDLVTPSLVYAGRTKPFASDLWLTQVATQYHVAPTLMVDCYGLL